MYATCYGLAILKSTSGGSPGSFVSAAKGIDPQEGAPFFNMLAVDPSAPSTLYFTGNHHVYQTRDGAANWVAISPDLVQAGYDAVSAIAVSPFDSNIVFAGTLSGRVFATSSAMAGIGSKWSQVQQSAIPGYFPSINAFAFDPFNQSTVFVVTPTYGSRGVLKSIDGGTTWSVVTHNLPHMPVRDIIFDPDVRNTLYVGTEHGIFESVDSGNNWWPLGTGLPKTAVWKLAFHERSRTLYAATYGRSVWKLTIPTAPTVLTSKNSASFATGPLASDMIAFAEAEAIAPTLVVASDGPWPTELGGVHLDITDSQGQTHPAPIYYVTTNAMTFLVPAGTALGAATAKLTTSAGTIATGTFGIERVSPGLSLPTRPGRESPRASGFERLPVRSTQDYLFDPAQPVGSRVPVAVDLGAFNDQVFLSLYGTGFRGAAQATATVGGVDVDVAGFAAVGIYQGEDVVNIGPLPRALAGRGAVSVVVNFDGKPANTVTVGIR